MTREKYEIFMSELKALCEKNQVALYAHFNTIEIIDLPFHGIPFAWSQFGFDATDVK